MCMQLSCFVFDSDDSGSNSDKYPDIESRGVLMEPRGLDGQNNQKFHSSSSISKEKSLEE